ncbi:hypothetical protein [Thalassobacillus hwangdonensis]|uniref:Spore coat protein YutH n=1 Tax=Thalassobacillus hwangdonensis TaxID=546108 RepID=A0ABW3L638_9BACI
MEELLRDFINLDHASAVQVDHQTGYLHEGVLYFVERSIGNERAYLELQDVCEFLSRSGIEGMTFPVRIRNDQYSISARDGSYVICQGFPPSGKVLPFSAQQLADFHRVGASYPYQPTTFSSYGGWRTLWANRIDRFEAEVSRLYQERPVADWHRAWIDAAPYVIGLGENAIQYLQESEQESRHHEADQPTITFDRYPTQSQTLIWFNELRQDHPSRDLAEAIRPMLLRENGAQEMTSFLQNYQARSPLSFFGIRLLYARLLFPVHLLDQFRNAQADERGLMEETRQIFENQKRYELHLKMFYEWLQLSARDMQLPVLDW